MSYRDAHPHKLYAERNTPVLPSAVMTHGIVHGRYQLLGGKEETLRGWSDNVVMYYGRIVVTMITPSDDRETLRKFYRLIQPDGSGWRRIVEEAERDGESITGAEDGRSNPPLSIVCMVVGCVAVYSALFGTGYWIYGEYAPAAIFTMSRGATTAKSPSARATGGW